jgi:nitroreductase/NAD-dependent dihydropyrimidine dehydrogenase PreA subunit
MAKITVDQTACTRCGGCVDVCATARVFEMTESSSTVVRPESCWHCGHCVAVCPVDAIDHDAFPLEDCPVIHEKELPGLPELIAAFRMRRSHRVFKDVLVDREQIRRLVSLGRWAPTASNNQSVDWIALDDPARIEELSRKTVHEIQRFSRLASRFPIRWTLPIIVGRQASRQLRLLPGLSRRLQRALDLGEDPVFYHAPVVLIGHCPSHHLLARDDAVFAAYNMVLAAGTLGLGTCQIGFFQLVAERRTRLRRAVGLPPDRSPQIALAVGYPRHVFRRSLPRRTPNLIWNTR